MKVASSPNRMEFALRRPCSKNTRWLSRRSTSLLKTILAIAGIVFCLCSNAFSQTIVKGKITDAATGAPVPFADIYIGGTTIGVVSDSDGEFKFEMRMKGIFDLIVSFI